MSLSLSIYIYMCIYTYMLQMTHVTRWLYDTNANATRFGCATIVDSVDAGWQQSA